MHIEHAKVAEPEKRVHMDTYTGGRVQEIQGRIAINENGTTLQPQLGNGRPHRHIASQRDWLRPSAIRPRAQRRQEAVLTRAM